MKPIRKLLPLELPLALLLGLVMGLAPACASSSGGSADDGSACEPLRVSHVDYRSARRLELVNEAHTSRLDQYSEVRRNANRKVQTNDVLEGLVEILYDYDFGKYEHPGPAPSSGLDRWAWALEIDGPNGPTYVLAGPGLEERERTALQRYAAAFLDIYNATYSLQAVELEPGASPFETPTGRRD